MQDVTRSHESALPDMPEQSNLSALRSQNVESCERSSCGEQLCCFARC
jgi:hypothetical protein